MKTNQLLISLFFAGGIFSMNAQTTIQTANLTSFGYGAGTSGSLGTNYGIDAGKAITTGSYNTFIGNRSGLIATLASNNTAVGSNSGASLTNASENVFIGNAAGDRTQTGIRNVYLGGNAGSAMAPNYNNGTQNVYIGYRSGFNSSGSNNVFLGYYAGWSSNVSNNLYIDNSATSTPLIWGDFALDQVKLNGKVGVGGVTAFPTAAGGANLTNYQLFVKGGVLAEEVRVATTWADYVFENNYVLPTLEEVECFIAENGHLPNVPSAKQVAEEGISLGDIAKVQQEKIEELTLYVIEQKKALNEQQSEIEVLKAQMKILMEKK